MLIRRPCLAQPTNGTALNIVYPVSANQEADTRPAPSLVCIRKELFECRLTLAEYTFVIKRMVGSRNLPQSEKDIYRNIVTHPLLSNFKLPNIKLPVERRISKKTFIPIKLLYLNNEKFNLAQRIRCEKKEETKD